MIPQILHLAIPGLMMFASGYVFATARQPEMVLRKSRFGRFLIEVPK